MTLSMVEKAFLLKKTDLFSGTDLDLLLAVAENLAILSCEKGSSVFKNGQKARRLYFLIEGCVEVANERNHTLAVLHPVDYFGDEALFSDTTRAYSVHCMKDSLMLTLSRSNLFHLIEECPWVALTFLRHYSASAGFRCRN